MMSDDNRLYFDRLPCFFNYLDRPGNDAAPFALVQDPDTGLVKQQYSEQTEAMLKAVYEEGSILAGGTMSHIGIGRRYAADFLEFLAETGGGLAGRKVLEAGCGTGYFLSLLKERGAEVLGVEPGRQGQEGAELFKVPIVNDFFPSAAITDRYDLVINFGVLEHISDFTVFLEGLKNSVKDGGRLVLAVPDAGPFLETGDISILIHEHWNYFTADTLAVVLAAHGLRAEVSRSSFGGMLYARATVAAGPVAAPPSRSGHEIKNFAAKFRASAEALRGWLKTAAGPEPAGIYVPGRAANLLSQIDDDRPWRLFDDEPQIHGRYYPGLPFPIENFQDLKDRPVKDLIIFSRTFARPLAEKISAELPQIKIWHWRDDRLEQFSR